MKNYFLLLIPLSFQVSNVFADVSSPAQGKRTIKNLLQTALYPVGKTLYVWGGGWNKEDNGTEKGAANVGLFIM